MSANIMKYSLKLQLVALSALLLLSCTKPTFVTVKDGQFVRNGKPYTYIGTNFWYGAILGSEGQGGNRERLCRELDAMKQVGIDNLRILVYINVQIDILHDEVVVNNHVNYLGILV